MCSNLPLKKILDKAYIDRLSTFEYWPKTYMHNPRAMAKAGFINGLSDQVSCLDCKIRLLEWEEKDDPMAIHKQNSPHCLFVKHFPEGYSVPDEEIIDSWIMSNVVQTYFQASDYPLAVVKAGLIQRLNTKFKNFSTLREIHLFFREKNPMKSFDVCGKMPNPPIYNPQNCKLCNQNKIDTVFVDCGHSIACKSCADSLITCRVCFHLIKKVQKITSIQ